MRQTVTFLGWVLLPAAAFALASLVVERAPAGHFQAGLAALVAGVLLGAFGTRVGWLPGGVRLVLAAVLVEVLDGVLFGGVQNQALAWLVFGCGAAASGLAAFGRTFGTPRIPAGAVAACVLWIAMGGLFWADPVAQAVPREHRRPFRQAVLHVDPALALAYDGAGYDRMRADDVYFEVPLASSLYDRPHARTTALGWLAVGVLTWGGVGLASVVGRRRGGMVGAAAQPGVAPEGAGTG